jgi:Mg2+ and Co2+ transporter CorA
MKTIAVMTMLFLPGTFFAALFALPLLQWTEPRIIQKNFWIYWAFTIPTTALVFVVWNILTGWTKSSRSIAR